MLFERFNLLPALLFYVVYVGGISYLPSHPPSTPAAGRRRRCMAHFWDFVLMRHMI
jgi:hypothetical protein